MNQTEFFLENDIAAKGSRPGRTTQNLKIAALLLVTALTLFLRQTGAGKPNAPISSGTPDNATVAKRLAGNLHHKQ